jgi:hypothetical protein
MKMGAPFFHQRMIEIRQGLRQVRVAQKAPIFHPCHYLVQVDRLVAGGKRLFDGNPVGCLLRGARTPARVAHQGLESGADLYFADLNPFPGQFADHVPMRFIPNGKMTNVIA